MLVAMSMPALKKFEPHLQPGVTVMADSTQIQGMTYRDDVSVIQIPATGIAMKLGLVQLANVVMIGAVMAALGNPTLDSMIQAIQSLLPQHKAHLIPLEIEALQAGMGFQAWPPRICNVNPEKNPLPNRWAACGPGGAPASRGRTQISGRSDTGA